jgi:predicted transglutaminase-like cysteine proteinase
MHSVFPSVRKPPFLSADRSPSRLLAAVGFGLLFAFQWLIADDFAIRLTENVIASAERKYGAEARQRLVAWMRLITDNRKKSETEKLKLANDFFNLTPFVADEAHWGRRDYWATPVEMLASGGGDCEDYAIGKYFSLLALGVGMDKLRITYVKAQSLPPGDQAHMVLTYYIRPDAVPLVLDNIVKEIRPASARTDLVPVYSFNGDGLWLAKERGAGRSVGGAGRISLWTEMNARLGKEFD